MDEKILPFDDLLVSGADQLFSLPIVFVLPNLT